LSGETYRGWARTTETKPSFTKGWSVARRYVGCNDIVMRLYVASSWRNTIQPQVVEILRGAAHDVYDFRNPREGENGFHWSEIDPEWKTWSPERYRDCLLHPIAEAGFASDMDALRWCEGVVAVQPFGRSASLELGWAAGAGKLTILLLADGEPDLMVKMCDHVCVDMAEVLDVLNHAVVHNAKFSRDSSG